MASMIMFSQLSELKQLRRPVKLDSRPAIIAIASDKVAGKAPITKGATSWRILDIGPDTVVVTSEVFLTTRTLSRAYFFEMFRPFGWTPSGKPGIEKATIWPWAADR
jgi:hypothetical protein